MQRVAVRSFTPVLTLCLALFTLTLIAAAQIPAPRITQAIDENQLTVLKGNTHPLARAEFDQGVAPPDLPMERMTLVLKRSAQQQSALDAFLDSQHDKKSANYHHWLKPEDFGKQFGPADQDIQTVTSWLESHGFQIAAVAKGKGSIEFSGTAAEVQQALHTTIHKYVVNGQEHWANSTDPQIPDALTPVVAGVNTLYNFPRKPMLHVAGIFSKQKATGKVTPVPSITIPVSGDCGAQKGDCYVVGPNDFATIYNSLPLWNASTPINGTGETIAIVGETDIDPNDLASFRSYLGLPALLPNQFQMIENGPDPGILTDGEETEADLDVEWSSAVAPGANIDFLVSQSTETSLGVDLSAQYIVDNDLAPIMSESYGVCELGLGTAGNTFFSQLWQQAAAEGITVMISAGDAGAAGCDNFDAQPPSPAQFGLAVNGFGSTPYNVAVGGTDFNDITNASTYWSTTNQNGTGESALKYIPETTWNDSCTNSFFGSNAEVDCNNSANSASVVTVGGSGGASNCTTSDGANFSTCSAHYGKPSWQTGAGVPADGARDLPDVSLFAASGSESGSFYIVCEADAITDGSPSCVSGETSEFIGVGGTSASSPAFAGVMAMVDQQMGAPQGNANYVLYKLATNHPTAFNDVTTGTIAMPCTPGSPDCTTATNGDKYGVLSGYSAGAHYDLATGLGSVNIENLVNDWSTVTFTPSVTTLNSITPTTLFHGQSATINATVAHGNGDTGTPTGTVVLMKTGGSTNYAIDDFVLSNGTINGSTTLLPGGTYSVTANYGGDPTFGGSISSPILVTVNPESSNSTLALVTFNSLGGVLNSNASTAAYGSPYILRANVGTCHTDLSSGMSACPTGSVFLTDNGNPLDLGSYNLNNQGYAEDELIQLPAGSHTLAATYSGDSSYSGSNSQNDNVTITRATTTLLAPTVSGSPLDGVPFTITTTVATGSSGLAPSGSVTFLANGSPISGTVSYSYTNGSIAGAATTQASISATIANAGKQTITASYSGDTNYSSSSSAATVVNVSDFALSASASTLTIATPGASGTLTLTINAGQGYTGTVAFTSNSCSGLPTGATCSFNPASVKGAGSTTLTVKTTASTASLHKDRALPWWMGTGGFGVAAIFLIGAGPKRRRVLLSTFLVALSLGIVGCGGGSSSGGGGSQGTPAGTYPVVVTATSGSSSSTATFSLVVQ